MRGRAPAVLATGVLVAGFLAGCAGGGEPSAAPSPEPTVSPSPSGTHHGATTPAPAVALREGERFVDLRMPEPYTPEAPDTGTDDYRCFLLDPGLTERAFVTGVDIVPGNPDLVHHVILFQVPPGQVEGALAKDEATEGQGWTCFGGTGLGVDLAAGLDRAPWIGAWAPGGGERVMDDDVGIPLEPGSRVVMQVHYNLMEGTAEDLSATRLRLAAGDKPLSPLDTMLLPAPVELPCRPGRADGALCDRDAAVADVMDRFGALSGMTVAGLQLLCGGDPRSPRPGPVQSCEREVEEPGTIRAVAGHMHLLGRRVTVELSPGTPRARTVLDVRPWDFDEQGAVPVTPPARIRPGDTLRVTCEHDQSLRDRLPALAEVPERYVVWGEGTTDEMCLGVVLWTRP